MKLLGGGDEVDPSGVRIYSEAKEE